MAYIESAIMVHWLKHG